MAARLEDHLAALRSEVRRRGLELHQSRLSVALSLMLPSCVKRL